MFFGKKFSGYHRGAGTLSGLDILVLSLIKNKKEGATGYDIIQEINDKFKDIWNASAGTIYPLLGRLVDKGLLEIEDTVENNRQKKISRITQKGNEALKAVLENNLVPSIDTLSYYIRTITASIPIEVTLDEKLDHLFSCCFPFQRFSFNESIVETDTSLENIKRVESILGALKISKQKISSRLEELDKRIKYYEETLVKIQQERTKRAKNIEIIDNDADFEKF